MKITRKIFFAAILICGFATPAFSYVSENVVGYINLKIHVGDNLIANHLYREDSTLDDLFGNGTPDGATFSKWDAGSHQFLPTSVYSEGSGWSIDYDFYPGEGAIFTTAMAFTNTFVGEVRYIDGDNLIFTYQTLSPGEHLVSCSLPYQSDFFHVIGRDPRDSESVRRLDLETQIYNTTTFQNGVWDNGDPLLRVGESAFFTLIAPALPIPEPSILVLLSGSLLALGASRRRE